MPQVLMSSYEETEPADGHTSESVMNMASVASIHNVTARSLVLISHDAQG